VHIAVPELDRLYLGRSAPRLTDGRTPGVCLAVTADGGLLFATRYVRLFAYGCSDPALQILAGGIRFRAASCSTAVARDPLGLERREPPTWHGTLLASPHRLYLTGCLSGVGSCGLKR
jgi:hypothetical protein